MCDCCDCCSRQKREDIKSGHGFNPNCRGNCFIEGHRLAKLKLENEIVVINNQLSQATAALRLKEKELTETKMNLVSWRDRALYHAPSYSSYKPAEPETTFGDMVYFFFIVIFPWLVILGAFLFGWNGILR